MIKFNCDVQGRIEAAKDMVQRLRSQNSRVADIVKAMEVVCVAYIQLANLGVSQHKTSTSEFNFWLDCKAIPAYGMMSFCPSIWRQHFG